MFKLRFTESYKARYGGAEPNNFTGLDFVGALGCINDALLYSRLFLPHLVEIDGMVFLSDTVDDAGGAQAVMDLLKQDGNAAEIERTLNYFQVNLNFPNRVAQNVEGDDRLLAEQLADAWTLRLQQTYPGRAFVMQVLDEDGEAGITFYQRR